MAISNSGKMCPAVTSINCTMEIGIFPADEDPCYLAEKAEYALRLPAMIITKQGAIRFLNQIIMSGLINIGECEIGYRLIIHGENDENCRLLCPVEITTDLFSFYQWRWTDRFPPGSLNYPVF
ncbi:MULTISPECIES: hypothetical protein [Photorhabdus]|uniref:hypothetical protein n=1 Tax=Photorhabdus TaxID=29487 RepID=UPI000B101502|nr:MULTISPECIES: hypothetical protein [Photorhabdus]